MVHSARADVPYISKMNSRISGFNSSSSKLGWSNWHKKMAAPKFSKPNKTMDQSNAMKLAATVRSKMRNFANAFMTRMTFKPRERRTKRTKRMKVMLPCADPCKAGKTQRSSVQNVTRHKSNKLNFSKTPKSASTKNCFRSTPMRKINSRRKRPLKACSRTLKNSAVSRQLCSTGLVPSSAPSSQPRRSRSKNNNIALTVMATPMTVSIGPARRRSKRVGSRLLMRRTSLDLGLFRPPMLGEDGGKLAADSYASTPAVSALFPEPSMRATQECRRGGTADETSSQTFTGDVCVRSKASFFSKSSAGTGPSATLSS
mmetsp:Transcript_7675/g.21997  ORF Transcript_7675/g.21997 Transcript_7675/m.21997 type:complete len:315 (-) Transcript_7675:408-1352(-)